jgi:hypothetical protein
MKHIYTAIIATLFALNLLAQVATFDDLSLTKESFWNGSDQSGSFKSGGITFQNSYNKDWNYWNGFAYSNTSDIATPGYVNQYSAIAGKGFGGSLNYAVCYPSPSAIVKLEKSTKVSGFYVTNSTYAYWSMMKGDLFSKKFGGESGNDPDFFKLKIESLDVNGVATDSIDFYLADFRFTDNSKDYILNKWTWVDMSGMKEALQYRFSLNSSDNSFGFMNTPGYFCMDNFNGEKPFDYKPVTSAGFENMNLGTADFYNGSDLKGFFTNGNFRFGNDYNAEWGSWSGFAVSAKTDATTPGYANQYSAITGMGVAGTPSYAVVYPAPVSTVTFKDTVVSGLYVTNSAYAYWSMKNGDAFSKKFGGETGNDEDWLILTIEGFNSDDKSTGKVEFFLADFGYSINSYDYILDSWKWIDLTKFGRISKLEFSLRSTDNGIWGMNTPAYFCIDNLNHQVPTFSPTISQMQTSVYPNPFSDQIFVSGIKEKARVEITDISGQKIAEFNQVSNNQRIDGLSRLKNGIYFIRIIEGNKHSTSRLLKK